VESIETGPEIETLVVDLGSQDGSAAIDTDFPKVTVLRLPKHFGATKAMNIATRTAAADYLFYLDPHVTLDKGCITGLAAILDGDSSITAVCPLPRGESGQPCPQAYRLPDSAALAEACESGSLRPAAFDVASAPLIPVEYASRSALMVRKDFIRGMNFFDERYGHAWPDLELAWQIQNAQRKTVLASKIGAVWHEPEPVNLDPAICAADRYNGAAGYLSKHNGFLAGLSFRISAIFKALFSGRFGLLAALFSGQKIDGTQ
jgi:GT2 family glycosyltransferase